MFRARCDQIVDLRHHLATLGRPIDWLFLDERFGATYTDKRGHPPPPTLLIAGLAIPTAMHDLSDEALCDRWIENPYFQLFYGGEFSPENSRTVMSSIPNWARD